MINFEEKVRKFLIPDDVIGVYVYEAAKVALKEVPETRRDYLKEKIEDYLWDRATTLFKYNFLACYGEARHGSEEVYCFLNKNMPDIFEHLSEESSRDSCAYSLICDHPRLDEVEVLQALDLMEKAFVGFHWSPGYGGEPWGRIARISKLYFENISAFLNMCFGLVHNGGLYLNKTDYGLTYFTDLMEKLEDLPNGYYTLLSMLSKAQVPIDLDELGIFIPKSIRELAKKVLKIEVSKIKIIKKWEV